MRPIIFIAALLASTSAWAGNITVNGKSFATPDGASISVINGELFINGKKVEQDAAASRQITIVINGNPGKVKLDVGNVVVNGSVSGDVSVNTGEVSVDGPVQGNATVSVGQVACRN